MPIDDAIDDINDIPRVNILVATKERSPEQLEEIAQNLGDSTNIHYVRDITEIKEMLEQYDFDAIILSGKDKDLIQFSNTEEDRFIDQKVKIEAHLYSGSKASMHSLMYWGKYDGIVFFGSKEMVALSDAGYFNRAGIEDSVSKQSRIDSERILVSLKDIVSISLNPEWA
jgi:hypothetical protein